MIGGGQSLAVLLGFYVLGAAIVFNFNAPAQQFDEEYHDGSPVALGPRPRPPLCEPHYEGGFDGKEWPFVLFAPVCSLWRRLTGYAAPARWRSYPYSDRLFDRQIWLSSAADRRADNPRGRMAQDLVDHYLKKGMRREQIIRLLGRPDKTVCGEQTSQFTNNGQTRDLYLYFLGRWGQFHREPNYLHISLDETGRLKDSWIFE